MRASGHIIRPVLGLLIAGIFSSTLLAWPQTPQAATHELNLQEYTAQLRAASSALDEKNTAAVKAFRSTLPTQWDVRFDGQSLKVETDWLDSALLVEAGVPVGDPLRSGRLKEAQEHIAALLESAEALAAPQEREADLSQSRARIERILKGREFQGSSEPSWWDKLKARIFAWIDRQLDRFLGRIGVPARVGSAIAWTLVVLAALLLAYWFVRWFIAATSRAGMDLHGARPAGHDWRYWAREAHAAAAKGDFRAAIHAAYWSALTRLEENHVLSEDRSRTPRESLRLVQRTSAAYTPLAQLTRRFELTWYGYRAATPADWDDAMKDLGTIECLPSSTATTASS